MDSPFDIFKKQGDGTLVWIAAAGQLHTAAALVADLHERFPGEYRVLDNRTGGDNSVGGTLAYEVRNLIAASGPFIARGALYEPQCES